MIFQPLLPLGRDLLFERLGSAGHVVFDQQVLREGQQQPIGGGPQAGLQHGVELFLFPPEAAQDQEALRRFGPHPRQDLRITGSHLQQQLVGGGPQLGLAHNLQV